MLPSRHHAVIRALNKQLTGNVCWEHNIMHDTPHSSLVTAYCRLLPLATTSFGRGDTPHSSLLPGYRLLPLVSACYHWAFLSCWHLLSSIFLLGIFYLSRSEQRPRAICGLVGARSTYSRNACRVGEYLRTVESNSIMNSSINSSAVVLLPFGYWASALRAWSVKRSVRVKRDVVTSILRCTVPVHGIKRQAFILTVDALHTCRIFAKCRHSIYSSIPKATHVRVRGTEETEWNFWTKVPNGSICSQRQYWVDALQLELIAW